MAQPTAKYHCLVTAFGPFYRYDEDHNPAWLAVAPLTNSIIEDEQNNVRPIHVSTLQIPVSYQSVMDIVPLLHQHPPVFHPSIADQAAHNHVARPQKGYDFILHVGVAGRGPLRVERVAHKFGYNMKDIYGRQAPVVETAPVAVEPDDPGDVPAGVLHIAPPQGESQQIELADPPEPAPIEPIRPKRGFGPSYENFQEEVYSDVNINNLIRNMKQQGFEDVYLSMDAGHYLPDFIYYCSLAEVIRSVKPYERRRGTQVLVVHVPPVGQPLTSEEVTTALKLIITWVCSELQSIDDTLAKERFQ
ncbi:hypothetical protein HDZ31DRAFT_63890 [Schizophyllum fasciatum]